MKSISLTIIILSLLLLFSYLRISAIDIIDMTGAKSHSLGNIVTTTDDFINPAGIINDKSENREQYNQIYGISVNNSFFIKELKSMVAGWRINGKNKDFSVLITRYGYQQYSELTCGLSVGKTLYENLSLGVRLNYFRMDFIDNQDNIFAVYPDIGINYKPVENLLLSMLISNPFTITYRAGNSNYYLPFSYALGMLYNVSNQLNFYIEAEKSYNIPFCFKTAFSWIPFKSLSFNIGFYTQPRVPTAGLGFYIGNIRADFAYRYHNVLGLSPSVSLTYNLNR